MTKRKSEGEAAGGLPGRLSALASRALSGAGLDGRRAGAMAASFALALAALLLLSPWSPLVSSRALAGFDAGKVADRDVVAERDVVYVDEAATEAAIRRRESEVLPIFQVDDGVTASVLARLALISAAASKRLDAGDSPAEAAAALRNEFPDVLDGERAKKLAAGADMPSTFRAAEAVLADVMGLGVVDLPEKGLDRYAQGRIELRTWRDGELVAEDLFLDDAVTLDTWASRLPGQRGQRGQRIEDAVLALASGLIRENAFFDQEASEKRLEAARKETKQVIKRIARGERIVRKGYLVDEAQIERLMILKAEAPGLDARSVFGVSAFLALCYAAGAVLLGRRLGDSSSKKGYFYFILIAATLYEIGAVAAIRALPAEAGIPFTAVMPTALLSMLVAILLGQKAAVALGFVLSLAVLPAAGLDAPGSAFVFLSSVAGAVSVRKTEKRLDLVKAGIGLAAFQAFLDLVVTALSGREGHALASAAWAGLNGFFCGMLALGFLPLMESALNAPTRFRLMELSDLNAPLLKRLLTVAPGTYSHSVMVANLAESACLDIGANALLARVAAYYHDIGKMDQPDYFVENQAERNKHSDLRPRLSAAVIRNHVKSGVEKARSMRLPDEVVEVISQHHGDGLIVWFYNQAMKEEGKVNPEEFSYPGTPPSSREAAVLLLADSVEAASRTLVKPDMDKLREFAGEIIMDKFRQGMLSASALSLKDLETIKNSFVRILAGHYHSRIEYPKIDPEAHE